MGNYDTLLCFTNGNELHIAIGALIIKPKKELILLSDSLDSDSVNSIKELLKEKGLLCRVSSSTYNDFIKSIDGLGSLAVLVNKCATFDEYKLLTELLQKGKDLFFADVGEGQVLSLKGDAEKPLPGGPIELDVDEVLEASGYNIQSSAEEMIKSKAIDDMLDFIIQDAERWDGLRRIIKNNYIPHGDWIQFGLRLRINYSDGSPMKSFVEYLEDKGYLTKRVLTKNHIFLMIPDAIIRTFIQTTGLWLEALTYRALHQLSFIDDAKADVRFLWCDTPCDISNEIDVMATADSRMIFISCKDMDNISTSFLNELEVYAHRIGGNKVIKILVTAKKPSGHHIFDRAEAMGINIVWYNNNIEKFTRILKLILEQELG